MDFIATIQEVELMIVGLLPEADRAGAVLLDIGSGNTKGGFLGTDGKAVAVSVPFGSVTYADRVTKDAPAEPFAKAADTLRAKLLEVPITEQIKANPALAERKIVFLAGGAPFAMVTVMHPEASTQERVIIPAAEIAQYLKKLTTDSALKTPDFDQINDPITRSTAQKDFATVRDNFTPQSLLAGAQLMTALVNTMHLEDKTIVFDRTSSTAWLRAYLARPAAVPVAVANAPADGNIAPKTNAPVVAAAAGASVGHRMPSDKPVLNAQAGSTPNPAGTLVSRSIKVETQPVSTTPPPAPTALPAPKQESLPASTAPAPIEPVRPSSQSPHVPGGQF